MSYRAFKSAPLLVGLALFLAGCDEPAAADAPQSTPPDVGIVTLKAEPFSLTRELPGRVAPTRVADVRPRVSGSWCSACSSREQTSKPAMRSTKSIRSLSRSSCRRARRRSIAPGPRSTSRSSSQSLDADGRCEGHLRGPARGRGLHRGAGPGRTRRPRGRTGARPTQPRLRHRSRAHQRPHRCGDGDGGSAGRAERHRQSRHHPAAGHHLCRFHPVGHRDEPAAPRVRERRP